MALRMRVTSLMHARITTAAALCKQAAARAEDLADHNLTAAQRALAKAQSDHQGWDPCRKNLKNSAVSKIRVVSFHVTGDPAVKRNSATGDAPIRKPLR